MNIFQKSFLELTIVILILVTIVIVVNYFSGDEAQVRVLHVSINDEKVILEIADNSYLRSRGLSGRDTLDEDWGMIFIYENELKGLSFWMKDTLIPLDMLFLDSEFKIVHIFENVQICEEDPCPSYTYEGAAQYVIELNAGWVEKNNVEIGDGVEIIARDQSDS